MPCWRLAAVLAVSTGYGSCRQTSEAGQWGNSSDFQACGEGAEFRLICRLEMGPQNFRASVEMPKSGGFTKGYILVDADTDEVLAAPFSSLTDAMQEAIDMGPTTLYRQNLDYRGRPIGSPIVLMKPRP
jgi:hypothetical protein